MSYFFFAVPLMMAYVTRYIFGTDKLRPNAFEVRGLNGASTGIIHCDDAAILSQWLKYITDNIVGLTNLQVLTVQTYYYFVSFENCLKNLGGISSGVLSLQFCVNLADNSIIDTDRY
jgi:hypothetical protein